MMSEGKSRQDTMPPDDFVEKVKDALEHLYDFPYLQNHPLLNEQERPEHSTESPAQQLRRELLEVIDTLNPGENVPL